MKVMEQKKFNKTMFLLAPLVLADDLLLNSDCLAGCYNKCADLPWMEEHLFLLYKIPTIAIQLELEQHLNENVNFHSLSSIRIDGEWYTLAIFNIPIKYLRVYKILCSGGNSALTNNLVMLYIKFWKSSDILDLEDNLYNADYNGVIHDNMPLKDAVKHFGNIF